MKIGAKPDTSDKNLVEKRGIAVVTSRTCQKAVDVVLLGEAKKYAAFVVELSCLNLL